MVRDDHPELHSVGDALFCGEQSIVRIARLQSTNCDLACRKCLGLDRSSCLRSTAFCNRSLAFCMFDKCGTWQRPD